MSLIENCNDFGPYPEVFNMDALPCMDVKIPDRPDLKVVAPCNYDVLIILSSFRGICPGAVHYYATIEAQQPYFTDGECMIGGYISEGWSAMPREITGMIGGVYKIEVTHKLTQDDIDNDPERWEGYVAGDDTNCFENLEQLLALAVGIVKLRFPGWQVKIEDYKI